MGKKKKKDKTDEHLELTREFFDENDFDGVFLVTLGKDGEFVHSAVWTDAPLFNDLAPQIHKALQKAIAELVREHVDRAKFLH